ncbi:MAG: shikimate dehydrogenase family protein, partial [Novosphingobium sp.]
KLGIAGDYRRVHMKTDGLADYFSARRDDPDWRGCNVTMPHKQAVIPLIDRLDPLAARIGAVNTVVREGGALVGYNTDAPGFLEPLRPLLGQTHYFRMARVLGTGGAARAIVAALADLGFTLVLAARIGAVNRVVREGGALVGYNTNAPGLLEPLRPLLGQTHYFRMARVLGTGGAARAIVAALAGEGMVIVLAGRDVDKARALLEELDPKGDHHVAPLDHFADATDFPFDDREGCLDLVVNASSLGMTGQDALRFDMSHAPPGSVFYDIVTSPLETDFLKAAKGAGFRTFDGLSMLIGQADHAFRKFFGAMPPRGAADAALRERLLG